VPELTALKRCIKERFPEAAVDAVRSPPRRLPLAGNPVLLPIALHSAISPPGHTASSRRLPHATRLQVAAKATLGVPRYAGVADIVRGYPALNNGKQVTAALSDVAINLLGEGDVADTGYARVGVV
jgi:hypothetical protein